MALRLVVRVFVQIKTDLKSESIQLITWFRCLHLFAVLWTLRYERQNTHVMATAQVLCMRSTDEHTKIKTVLSGDWAKCFLWKHKSTVLLITSGLIRLRLRNAFPFVAGTSVPVAFVWMAIQKVLQRLSLYLNRCFPLMSTCSTRYACFFPVLKMRTQCQNKIGSISSTHVFQFKLLSALKF